MGVLVKVTIQLALLDGPEKNALSEGVEILTTNCNMGVSETELCTSKTASVNRENDEKLSNL
jgi:hypothetical protein